MKAIWQEQELRLGGERQGQRVRRLRECAGAYFGWVEGKKSQAGVAARTVRLDEVPQWQGPQGEGVAEQVARDFW